MRNVWKGLVVGGVTGAAIGFILDRVSKEDQRPANVWRGLLIGSGAGASVGIVVASGTKATDAILQAADEADLAAMAADFGAKASAWRERAERSDAVQSATDRALEAAQTGAGVLHQASDVISDVGNRSRALVK